MKYEWLFSATIVPMAIGPKISAMEIKKAATALKNGHLVAFPTETVYGLGADATNEKSVTRIYEVKGRPKDHPLIVHISSIELLDKWAIEIPSYARTLAHHFWPGPMTLVFKRTDIAKDFITGEQNTVGIRIPSNATANQLLSEFEKLGGLGIAAPSANKFGKISPTSFGDVVDELGTALSPLDMIIDGGHCQIGLESTIISCTSNYPMILRPGGLTFEKIKEKINLAPLTPSARDVLIKVPGNLSSHYSPNTPTRISTTPKKGEGLIAMSEFETPDGVIRLLSPNSYDEYANLLYSALRRGDKLNLSSICIVPPNLDGIGVAICDRINKIIS